MSPAHLCKTYKAACF